MRQFQCPTPRPGSALSIGKEFRSIGPVGSKLWPLKEGNHQICLKTDKPESKSQAQSQIEKGKGNLDSGLSLKSYGPPPPHPQLLSMKEVSNKKTQRVKVTQYDPLYLLSTKNRWTAKGKKWMSPTCLRGTLSKKCFKSLCDSEWSSW